MSAVDGRVDPPERDRHGWSPERYDDLAGLLTRLACELVREPAPQA